MNLKQVFFQSLMIHSENLIAPKSILRMPYDRKMNAYNYNYNLATVNVHQLIYK